MCVDLFRLSWYFKGHRVGGLGSSSAISCTDVPPSLPQGLFTSCPQPEFYASSEPRDYKQAIESCYQLTQLAERKN